MNDSIALWENPYTGMLWQLFCVMPPTYMVYGIDPTVVINRAWFQVKVYIHVAKIKVPKYWNIFCTVEVMDCSYKQFELLVVIPCKSSYHASL